MDQGTDQGTDPGEEGRWLTYRELAESRQIDRHSAVKLVMKHGWRRQRDNRNVLRILVPVEWLAPRGRGMPKTTADTAMPQGMPEGVPQGTDFTHAINTFADAVASLTKRAESAEERADRAELATTELRTKIEQLQAELTAAEAGRGQAETDARELRAHEAALQLQLAETTAALQDAAASDARAEQAEAAIAAERVRADELQAGQELMMDMHARAQAALQGDLDMARAQATTAHDALKAVRQAQAERRARGLLARLRAAVRGE